LVTVLVASYTFANHAGHQFDACLCAQAVLLVNGEMMERQTAPWPASLTSRKVVGRYGYDTKRNLNADIADPEGNGQ